MHAHETHSIYSLYYFFRFKCACRYKHDNCVLLFILTYCNALKSASLHPHRDKHLGHSQSLAFCYSTGNECVHGFAGRNI